MTEVIGIRSSGRGANLPVPTLPAIFPVTVQLVIDDGVSTECWGTVYSTPRRNTATQREARGP